MALTPGESIPTTQSSGAQSLDGWFRDTPQSNAPTTAAPAPASGGLNAWFDEPKPVAQQRGGAPAFSPISSEALDQVATAEGLTPRQRQMMGVLLEQESGSGRNAKTSVDGARGAGQILPATFQQYAKPGERIDDPASNLAVAARIIKDLGTKSGDDPARIATGYFSGPGNMNSGAGDAWRNDAADGNGKRVSSYVGDVLARLAGAQPAVAAESAPQANPIATAPKWAAVTAKPEYQALSDGDKQAAREAYFQRFIAPNINPGEEPKYREWFDKQTAPPAGPGIVDRTVTALGGAREAIREAAGTTDEQQRVDKLKRMGLDAGVMTKFAKETDTPNGQLPKQLQAIADLPATDEFKQKTRDQWAAADPATRKTLEQAGGYGGFIAKQLNSIYGDAKIPTSAQVQGESRIEKTDFDFDAQKAYNDPKSLLSNPVVRGAVKGVEGYRTGSLGLAQFAADALGADDFAAAMKQQAKVSGNKTAAMGESGNFVQRNFEGAVSSIAQQLPALVGGAATGSEALVLGSMFAQTFGQEYGQAREAGKDMSDAAQRAAIFGSFEVAGEKLGLGEQFRLIRQAARGQPTGVLAGWLANTAKKELPGELFTTTGEFLTDKAESIGLNKDASFKDYLDQMADTAVQTFMQSGVMGAGVHAGGAVADSMRSGSTRAADAAEAARGTALNRWMTDGLSPSAAAQRAAAGQPAPAVQAAPATGRVEPTIGEEQPAPPAAAAIPAQTGTTGIADQDVLDYADSRYRQLVAQRDGEIGPVEGDSGDIIEGQQAGAGLSADDAAELALLQKNRGNARALSAQYGFDTSQPGKAEIDAAAHEAASSPTNDLTPPTVAQATAGNYKKGSIKLHGLDIAIENPQGSTRSGIDADGQAWSSTLTDGHYGYLRGTKGADGDGVDVFVGPHPQSTKVFVIDQIDPKTGRYDESKIMLGYDSQEAADGAYHANHEQGWNGMGGITETTTDGFKAWLADGDTTKPFGAGPFMPAAAEVPEAAELVRRHRAALTDYKAAALAGDEQAAQAAAAALAAARADMDTAQQNVAERAQASIQEAADAPLPKPKTEKQAREQRAAKSSSSTTVAKPIVDKQAVADAKHARQDEEVRKAAANIAARAAAKEAAKEQVATPAQTALIDQAVKSKIITPGSLRAERFRAGIMDATSGTAPASAERSYLEGHAWALAKQNGAAPAEPAAKPKTEKAAKAARAAEPTTEDVNDELYQQAVDTVLKSGSASVSLVQRTLKIGYNRVQRIMEQMESNGVVGPMASNGSREILKKPAAPKPKKTLADQRPAKVEYPAPMGNGEGAMTTNKGQRAVVDYMNGEITKDQLIEKLGALDLYQGAIASITTRTEDFTMGDIKKVMALQQKRDFNLPDLNTIEHDQIEVAWPDDTEPGENPASITAAVKGKGAQAYVFAEDNADGSYSIQESGLPPEMRGQGIGVQLYERLLAELFRRGQRVTSDNSVSKDAQRIYKALEKRGYIVEQNPAAVVDEETGALEANGPVYTIGANGVVNDIDLTQDGPLAREAEPVRVNTLAKLKALEKKREAGKLTDAEYQMAIQSLIGKLETRNDAQQDKKARPRERGELWLRERLLRAKRTGELSADQVDFALWALDQNPNIANDLGISLRESKGDGVAGNYIPGSRIINLVKGNGNMETVVHEIMHHTERMMPPAIQQGIVTEWSRAMGKAWKNGTPAVREALQNMMLSSAGDKMAHEAMMKAFRDKTLNFEDHYQLANASEYWAVNASEILAKRADAAGRWVAQARQWLREMIEKIKNLLNLPSSAPVLAGLQRVLDGQGKRLSNSMLVEISNSQAGTVLDRLNNIENDYGDQHRPPSREDGAPLSDLTGDGNIYPADVYSAQGPRYYGTGNDTMDRNAFRIANMAKGKPDFDVMVYRAIPSDIDAQINPGDWVSIDRKYAEMHGESRFDGDYKIISKMVKADDIFTNGDSIQEWGYDPKGEIGPLNSLDLRTAAQKAQAQLVDEFGKPTFSNIDWWDKSIGTQYHKAAKNPLFKKVFDLAIKRENAVSLTAVRAASLAPGFLPRIDDFMGAMRTLAQGRRTGTQTDLAGKALLEGTLDGTSVINGKVWTAPELRAKGLNDQGIALYRQAREAIDASLDEVAAAEGYSTVHSFVPKSIREQVIDDPRGAQSVLSAALAKRIQLDELHLAAQQRNGASPAAVDAAKAKLTQSYDVRDTLAEIFDRADQLKRAGYTPLMRFGNYYVQVEEVDPQTGKTVINPDTGKPNTLYFSRFETEAEASDAYFREQVANRGKDNIKVSSGPVNDESFKMYSGISPETLELFADVVGAKEATEKFYQVALSERSALKRRITRDAIEGYSENMPRVLANFITSNGKFAAQRYYNRDINNAIRYIPRLQGDVQKEAVRLKEYIDNPGNGGAIASALSFTWFLGGNIASALVNATQPVMMTLPYLSQFGAGRAAAALTRAAPYAMGRKQIMDADLKAALKRGSQEGKVDAQEIFHLYSVGIQGVASILSGKLSKLPLVGSKVKGASESARARMNALGTLWGMPFAMVEGFNRRLTFIAAWDVAKATGNPDPYQFAVDAVDQTQGVYNKVNRPNWARGPVGRVVFTFAQFKIMNVEMLKRLATMGGPEGKKAAAMYLATLILVAGLAGVPYADDVDDIIDTVGQWLGYNTNMKRTKREWAYKTLGRGFGDLALYGVSAHLPVDIGGRMGLGNMFPATGILKPSGEGNRAQDIMELGGPAISGLGKQIFDAYDAASMGNYGKAAMTMMPTAVKNAATGAEMAVTGKAKDMKGRVKTDVTVGEAVAKGIGLNPTVVAEKNRANMPINQDLALQKLVESSIVDQWAQGAATGNKADIDAAMARMKNWNEKNPETPVSISAQQLRAKVKTLMTPTDTRLLKGAPKEMRARVVEGLKKKD